MSQYKISKARLAQIIKEEYQSLHEEVRPAAPVNALTRNINRWSEEGKDIPMDQTVGRADRSDQLGDAAYRLSWEGEKQGSLVRDVASALGVLLEPMSEHDEAFAANRGRQQAGVPRAGAANDQQVVGSQQNLDRRVGSVGTLDGVEIGSGGRVELEF